MPDTLKTFLANNEQPNGKKYAPLSRESIRVISKFFLGR